MPPVPAGECLPELERIPEVPTLPRIGRRHDYVCLACDTVLLDVFIPSGVTAVKGAPDCPYCEGHMPMEWRPAIGAMSVFSESSKSTTTVEDPSSPSGHRRVEINSLRDIRRLEQASEQAERNGEGRRMVWRDFSQDRSNTDVHTLGKDPSLRPSKRLSNGQPVVRRVGDAVTADHGTVE